jgi:hypothetical protein
MAIKATSLTAVSSADTDFYVGYALPILHLKKLSYIKLIAIKCDAFQTSA